VVAERYVRIGERRFDTINEHFAQSGADAVLVSLVGTDSVHMCRAFGKARLSDKVLRLSVAIDQCALLDMGHQNTDGMYIAHGYFSGVDSNATGSFMERYQTRFGARAHPGRPCAIDLRRFRAPSPSDLAARYDHPAHKTEQCPAQPLARV
jgi:urea transport system substrate-binding protein